MSTPQEPWRAGLQLARTIDPVHNLVYFAPEARWFKDAGLASWWQGYFTHRAAPLGPVPVSVVTAIFYNFAPRMVEAALPAAWDVMSPTRALELRLEVVDHALRRLLGPGVESDAIAEAARLGRDAAEACGLAGRPLYAANASLPWPEARHLELWHATTLLRELRFDAHNAALAAAGLDGVECHVMVAAQGRGNRASILPIRGWNEAEWDAAEGRLVARGLVRAGGAITDAGAELRREVERQTSRIAAEPWERLGPEGVARLGELLEPTLTTLRDEGGVPTSWPPPHLLRPDDR